ncbi:MAG: thioredoxin domain-containing protein [Patescibacteria group bacterium]
MFHSLSPLHKKLLILLAIVLIGVGLFLLMRPDPVSGVPEPKPTADISQEVMAKLVSSEAPTDGPSTAKVTVTEFLDYQCEGCAQFQPVMDSVRAAYAGRVRFVVRHFPLVEGHPFSKGAAIAATCAGRQGSFFPYSTTLFAHQDALARVDLERYAADAGLDAAAFTACLDDASVAELVMNDRVQGQELGVRQTPSIFINDAMLSGIPSEEEFRSLIEGTMGEER